MPDKAAEHVAAPNVRDEKAGEGAHHPRWPARYGRACVLCSVFYGRDSDSWGSPQRQAGCSRPFLSARPKADSDKAGFPRRPPVRCLGALEERRESAPEDRQDDDLIPLLAVPGVCFKMCRVQQIECSVKSHGALAICRQMMAECGIDLWDPGPGILGH
jgi:hypothetical protein